MLDFWEDSYAKLLAAMGKHVVWYFVFLVFLGHYFMVNLVLAVVVESYSKEVRTRWLSCLSLYLRVLLCVGVGLWLFLSLSLSHTHTHSLSLPFLFLSFFTCLAVLFLYATFCCSD